MITPTTAAGGSRARILVVDDEAGMLRVVARIFGGQYEVKTAASGAAALEALRAFPPDVAIVDIRMPEMNGFVLMRELHARMPDLDVILMTGNAEEPDAQLVQAIDEGAFYFIQKPFERRVLLALVSRCLELRQLREERQRHIRRLEKELEEARQFQQSILPPPERELLGVPVSARYVPCAELGGDFYDYAEAGRSGLAVIVADVVGHGASAAMMTGIVKSAFHAAAADGFAPLAVIQRVKAAIVAFDEGRFLTLACARLDLASGELAYANAGHPPPILHRPGAAPRLLEPTGMLISSAFADFPCDEGALRLQNGDVLLFYTDGVSEAQNAEEMFGRDRIVSLLSANGVRGGTVLDRVLSAVSAFCGGRPPHDDMTLLAFEYPGR